MKSIGFSPLAGIRYVETAASIGLFDSRRFRFSPLAGIRYVETQLLAKGVFKS